MYQHARYQVWSHVEELVLAKVSLLLSLWCGPKRDVTTNSLWSDRAIYHTKQFINKSSSKMNPILPKRNKILYWCCIIRNTFISYAMRRPYRLCSEEMSVCDPEAVRSEFEFELLFHDYSSPGEKLRMVEDFVTICKLANNLSSILRSQRSLVFGIDWRSEEPESPVTTNNNELHQCLAKYLGAAKHESELLELKDEYEDKTRFMEPRDTEHNEEMLTKMRSYTIHLIIYVNVVR
ncbi:hypothetical protein K505DRAFT_157312 [Melanomma pulvis-pyrius CBS 109.77]|uniref:Transcription factor domain-containing protein n=1 Tax=Melanomma pulvis-pyrius CBS 109.77 TaxID=1314802 RepID=A0A6A6XKJ2_9PLEO|nr:hypothetical protein K505DRAFT_157312 [Melanomma pulvis-pyrius CBS 109.77]